jgi:hypothetical protein
MTEKELIGKDGEGIDRGLVEVHSWHLPGRNEENIRLTGVPLETHTRHPSNTSTKYVLDPVNSMELCGEHLNPSEKSLVICGRHQTFL